MSLFLPRSVPPIITLITPCRNSAHLLTETIDSILTQSALQRGSVRLEYLIIDGNSSDETATVVKPYLREELQFISEPDTGMYDALAKGLTRARGEIIGYLNAGDILFPHAFEILAEVFTHPNVDWVTGYSTHINDHLQITATWKPPRYRRAFIENGYYVDSSYPQSIQQESTFWSRRVNAVIDVERLRAFKLAGDYFLWTELAKQTELHSIGSLLGAFRIHAGQLSENKTSYYQECLPLLRKPTFQEKLTRFAESSPPWLKGFLWNYTMGRSPAKIFEYHHQVQQWLSR